MGGCRLSTAVLDEKLYIIGGLYEPTPDNWVSSDAMYCFVDHPTDPSAATWALQSAKLSIPRYQHASIVFQRRIWVAGGDDSHHNTLSSVEVFDAAVNKWESAPAMVRDRRHFKLVVVENELYAVGGEWGSMSIEKLSKFSGAWQMVAEIDEDRWFCDAAAVGSKIYVFGGSGGDAGGDANSTWNAFDVGTGQWASASTPASKRKLSSRGGFFAGQALTVPSSMANNRRMTWYRID